MDNIIKNKLYTLSVIIVVIIALYSILLIIRWLSGVNSKYVKYEPFSESDDIDTQLTQKYNMFLDFYTAFCASWDKAITTTIAYNTPQQPLSSPSQVSSIQASQPSQQDMSLEIRLLEKQLGMELPSTCIEYPQKITDTNITDIINNIPSDSTPYINALQWMNKTMANSHSNLQSALNGNIVEKFVDNTQSSKCDNVEECIKNNPDIINKIQKQNIHQNKLQLLTKLENFMKGTQLQSLQKENTELVAKSQKIQEQAQSGELFKQVNIQDNTYYSQPTMPEGGNNLATMQKNNPQRYNELKQNYSQWFNIKSLMEQINSNLVQ